VLAPRAARRFDEVNKMIKFQDHSL